MSTAVAALESASPVAPELQALLAAACGGQLPLADVMNRAQLLHAAGQTDAAALLYETWITHTESPLRPVACFNRGTCCQPAAARRPPKPPTDRRLTCSPALLQLNSTWATCWSGAARPMRPWPAGARCSMPNRRWRWSTACTP